MTTPTDLDHARAEVGALREILDGLGLHRVLERRGIAARLEAAQRLVEELERRPPRKLLPIVFRGAPVHGDQSVDANFGLAAVKALVDATDVVAVTYSGRELRASGPLPRDRERSLRISNTLRGSFGFELELPPPVSSQTARPLDDVPDAYELAIQTTFDLLDNAASGDEGAVLSLVAEIHPRAAAKVRAFVRVLRDHHAQVSAEFAGRQLRLETEEQLDRALAALREEDISEREETLTGRLLGVLPQSRRFELQTVGGLIEGRVDRLADVTDLQASMGRADDHGEQRYALRIVTVRRRDAFVLVGRAPLEVGESDG